MTLYGIFGNPLGHTLSPAMHEAGFDALKISSKYIALELDEAHFKQVMRGLKDSPLSGTVGIGHTRWATHGVPNEVNAHPHFSENVAVVHNGIIENFRALRDELSADGYVFTSQTDTEVVAHLVSRGLKQGLGAVEAAHKAIGLRPELSLCASAMLLAAAELPDIAQRVKALGQKIYGSSRED